MKREPIRRAVLRAAPLCLLAACAHANPNDSLRLTANLSATYDDNLFRVAKGVNPVTAIGRASPSETITAATGAISFSKDYGLQHVDLRASAVRYDYKNFSYLNFTAFNYTGGLRWQLTPRLRGTITSDRQETLNSFNDFQNFTQRNQRTVTNSRADALYELDGAYQLTAGASRLDISNSTTVVQQRAFVLTSADIGLRRVSQSGSEIAYRLRVGGGDYSDVSFASSAFLPSSFDDIENEVRVIWLPTAKSQLVGRIAYLQRKYNTFAFRDYSGVNASASFNWGITAQTRLSLTASRDLSDYQTQTSNVVVTDRLAVVPSWQITPKVTLRYREEFAHRRFNGSVPGFAVSDRREDDIRFSRLSVDWKPREQIDVSGWIQRDKRDSNIANFGYVSRSIGLLAQVAF